MARIVRSAENARLAISLLLVITSVFVRSAAEELEGLLDVNIAECCMEGFQFDMNASELALDECNKVRQKS